MLKSNGSSSHPPITGIVISLKQKWVLHTVTSQDSNFCGAHTFAIVVEVL
jgi:hypothetical protein